MKNKIFITIMLVMLALACNGQSFLSKYPKLTKKNLPEFFSDWEAYSDSISSRTVKKDSLIDKVVAYSYAPQMLEGRTCLSGEDAQPKYHVAPRYIKVERYYMNVDTTMAKANFGFPSYIPDMKNEQYSVDSITPVLPHGWLYITDDIYIKLSVFVGGLKKGEKICRIHKKMCPD